MILLQDMHIVEVYQGSEIIVKSRDEANKFIEKFKNIDSINSIKNSYNIPLDKKVILYAPTWRDDEFYENGV